MNQHITHIACIYLISVAASTVSSGAILADYDLSTSGTTSRPATAVGAGVSADNFTINEPAVPEAGSIGFSSAGDGSVFLRTRVMASNETGAVASGYYFSFTVSATNPNDRLNLSQLTFDFGGSSADESAFDVTALIYSDISGDTVGNALFSDTQQIPADITASPSLFPDNVVDLSAAQFQNISTVTFYLRGYDGVGISQTNQIFRADNFVLEGTVSSIPEPSVVALILGACGLSTVALIRRRAK